MKNSEHKETHRNAIYMKDKSTYGGKSQCRGRGRGEPLPEGRREGVETRYATLNHLSPEGWWDFIEKISKGQTYW